MPDVVCNSDQRTHLHENGMEKIYIEKWIQLCVH